ncbi:MAG: dipeptidase [Deltaproteobacteria bacterium]|nr:dipeptidase [Deltaproteobacteria bacterium]
MNDTVLTYIEKNRDQFLESLNDLIRVESISSQPAKKSEVLRCADLEVKKFREIGLENAARVETIGYPLVYGDWLHAPGKPTLLIYGHYDVQPPDPLDQWTTPPFEPTVKDGNLYARGSSDNKAQHFSHLCAIEAWLKTTQKLPINIKVVLEGEEEVGSGGLDKYLREHPELFTCDAVMISDMPWLDKDHPAIAYSLKGLDYFEIKVKGSAQDLHSGLYGGMVRNPLQSLSWILSRLKDESEKILIPHFYDDVKELNAAACKEVQSAPFDAKTFAKEIGVSELVSEEGYTPIEHNWTRPTLDVCGIWGGYQGVGAKTIIPAEASAKVSIRLVANQEPKKITKLFVDYVKSICPTGVSCEVHVHSEAWPVFVDRDHPFLKKTAKAYEQGFGKKVIFMGQGASIPVVATFQSVLKVPVILIGLGLPDDRLHSPNEKIALANFFGGIKGAALAYEALGE